MIFLFYTLSSNVFHGRSPLSYLYSFFPFHIFCCFQYIIIFCQNHTYHLHYYDTVSIHNNATKYNSGLPSLSPFLFLTCFSFLLSLFPFRINNFVLFCLFKFLCTHHKFISKFSIKIINFCQCDQTHLLSIDSIVFLGDVVPVVVYFYVPVWIGYSWGL